MAFASDAGSGAPMSEMNVTPLVDVMLVLLIIFMVTAPTPSFPINIDLPQPVLNPPPPPADPPLPIRVRIDASGQVFWNEGQVPLSALRNMMESEVQKDVNNQPTLEIDTNADADYGTLAKVLAAAKNAQMLKIGFVKN